MIILYKVCFNVSRVNNRKNNNRPITGSTQELITVCITSVLKQMESTDSIVFFLDGEDSNNIIHHLCNYYNVDYKILKYSYSCPVKINNETTRYIIEKITDDEIIYLCEDDYLHYNDCLKNIKQFLQIYPNHFCHPTDYPNLYFDHLEEKFDKDAFKQYSEIIVTDAWHWRQIKSTTYTFAFRRKMFNKYRDIFLNINAPLFWAHVCNLIFVFEKCFSPIPSLCSHIEHKCLPPCIDTKKIYENIEEEARNIIRSNLTIKQWEDIYDNGGYDNVGSGPGSLLKNNYSLISWLTDFLHSENISSMLDIGCGDLQWMREIIKNTKINYYGVDGAENIIDINKKTFPQVVFDCLDIENIIQNNYSVDLFFIKDILQHFSISRVKNFIKNITTINPTHTVIITPRDINRETKEILIESGFKLVVTYLSDEVKSIFIKNPFLNTYKYIHINMEHDINKYKTI